MHKRKSSLTLLAFAASMACWYGVLGQCFCYQKGSSRLCQASFGGSIQPETRRDAKKLSFWRTFLLNAVSVGTGNTRDGSRKQCCSGLLNRSLRSMDNPGAFFLVRASLP
ncbi:hypothetical protein SAMN05660971_03795 [Halomonas cupida]|uniref:Uncharacterized protein n=1 Tax=Halomonas cupida TaxID=44933 RepID=A0A1M7LCA8_9GAMM|nr:hypothetical protein SAMN05660971_03795 [Halomonas cupida]